MNMVIQWVVTRTYEQQCHTIQVGFCEVTFLPLERQGFDAVAYLWGNNSDPLREPTEYRSLVRSHSATTDNQDMGIADAYVDRQELHLFLFNQYLPEVFNLFR